jgi:hypothetical protein
MLELVFGYLNRLLKQKMYKKYNLKNCVLLVFGMFLSCNAKDSISNIKLEELGELKKNVQDVIIQNHDNFEEKSKGIKRSEDVCSICLLTPENIIKLECNHILCSECLKTLDNKKDMQNINQIMNHNPTSPVTCPYCINPLTEADYNRMDESNLKQNSIFYTFRTLKILIGKDAEFWSDISYLDIFNYLKYTLCMPLGKDNVFDNFIHEDNHEGWQEYEIKAKTFAHSVIRAFSYKKLIQ